MILTLLQSLHFTFQIRLSLGKPLLPTTPKGIKRVMPCQVRHNQESRSVALERLLLLESGKGCHQ